MIESVEARGFFAAWREHLPDIARRHRDGDGARAAHLQLWRLMQHDPALRAHIDEATARSVAAEAAAPSEPVSEPQSHRAFIDRLRHGLRRNAEEFPAVREADGLPMRCLRAEP